MVTSSTTAGRRVRRERRLRPHKEIHMAKYLIEANYVGDGIKGC